MRYRLLSILLVLFFLPTQADAQTMSVLPPLLVEDDGSTTPQLLFSPTEQVLIQWSENISGGFLKIGTSPGIYTLSSVPVSGTNIITTPAALGLSSGKYYAIVTTASANTLGDIILEVQGNPSLDYSTEFSLIVESASAASAIAPLGTINDATPTLEWTGVPGVPAYLILLSSTPFVIEKDPVTDIISVEGATIIWQILTTGTSTQYGDINPNSTLPIYDAPPLISGNEYSYTILNVYDEENAVYTSDVFGSISTFTYEGGPSILPPTLQSPEDQAVFYGDGTITFRWDPVDGANSYSFYMLERTTEDNLEVDVPVWNGTTTNTLIDFSARVNLRRGRYVWYVVPVTNEGAGNASETRIFDYEVEMGEFRLQTRSATDNTELAGVEVRVRSLEGGYTPGNPFLKPDSGPIIDDLVVGIYEFETTKENYENSTFVVEILADERTNINVLLEPIQSAILGIVEDTGGAPVGEAEVTFLNTVTDETSRTTSSGSGGFRGNVPPGTYNVQASKSGYISSVIITVNLDQFQQLVLPEPFVITEDAVTVSGQVINQSGAPVQLASIVAEQNGVQHQVTTNGSGNYSIVLSSGQWTFTVTKTGFVSPDPVDLDLTTGENHTDQNFVLTERANQVTGTVTEEIELPGGQINTAPLEDATVTATPISGTPFSTTTDANGQYLFSLPQGTFLIQATKPEYTPSDETVIVLDVGIAQTISDIDFQLQPNSGSISGIVLLPDGTPMESARVHIEGLAEELTSSSGAYTLGVPPGTHVVTVSATGFIPPDPREISLSAGQDVGGIDFVVTPNAGVIAGTVTSSGSPLSGARVTATKDNDTVTTTTDSRGRYELSVFPGTWTLVATKIGFLPGQPESIIIGPGQESLSNDIDLFSNQAQIRGTVTDGVDPVRNASVTVTDLSDPTNTRNTQTLVNGEFISSVEANRAYQVTVFKEGFSQSTQESGVLAVGDVEVLSFVVTPVAATVSGTLFSEEGETLSSVKIVALQSNNQNAKNNQRVDSTMTLVSGAYTLGLPAGTFQLLASLPGYFEKTQEVTLAVGQTLTNIDYTLESAFATLRGHIRDESDNGIPDAFINLTSPLGGASTTTAADGSYILPRLVGDTYQIEITTSRHADSTITAFVIPPEQVVVLNVTLIRQDGEITGRTLDTSGQPVPGVTITGIHETSQIQYSTLSTADGTFTLSDLPLGSYSVSALKTGFTSTDQKLVILSAEEPSASTDIDDLVPNTAGIGGVVYDSGSGTPLQNAEVIAESPTGTTHTVSNTQGIYNLENIAPGTYTVTAALAGYSGIAREITAIQDQAQVLDLFMTRNDGQITGIVTNQAGAPLPFSVDVTASSGMLQYSTKTGIEGNFSLSELATGRTYTLNTVLFREGYVNTSASIDVPSATPVGPVYLRVNVNTAVISGDVGTPDATIQLINTGNENVETIVSSNGDGSYRISLLSDGSYRVEPSKRGIGFNPVSANVSLNIGEHTTVDFIATSNIGTISVLVTDQSGVAAAGAKVSVLSTDGDISTTRNTDDTGLAVFDALQGGRRYVVAVHQPGFTVNPLTAEVDLSTGAIRDVSFTLIPSNSLIRGTIFSDGTTLEGASVIARRTENNQEFRTISSSQGYEIQELPAGSYELTANKQGFRKESLLLSLSENEEKDGLDFSLIPNSVRLTGRVVFAGAGQSGITVTATGTSTLSTTTNENGRYNFENLPITENPANTSLYVIGISGADISSQTQTVSIPGTQIGQTISLPDFVLPSGQISLTFTDGVEPLAGVNITFTRPGGQSIQATTGADGRFESVNKLQLGTHRLTAYLEGYLRPSSSLLTFVLPTNDTVVDETVLIPYRHTPLSQISASEDTPVEIRYTQGFSPDNETALLLFKRASQDRFSEVVLTLRDGMFTGSLPAQFSLEEIFYYIEVRDVAGEIRYSTKQLSYTPIAEGILTTMRFRRSWQHVTLRLNDEYTMGLILRDGIGESLLDDFVGSDAQGSLQWSPDNPDALSVSFPTSGDSTVITLAANQIGTYSLQVTAQMGGAVSTVQTSITIIDAEISTFAVTTPIRKLNNRSAGVQFSYSANDSSGISVLLGNSLQWTVTPADAGTITDQGYFVPEDSTYIGVLDVVATDALSELSALMDISIFARINGSRTYSLSNKQGLFLTIPQGAIPFIADIGIGRARPGPAKKYVSPDQKNQLYTVADRIYKLTFQANQSLRGDSLAAPATLELPMDASLRLNEGPRFIGHFDPVTIQWKTLPTTETGIESFSTDVIWRFGEYGLLVENEPLGLRYVSILPSPFSPDIAPVKIGYLLTSAVPPVQVTIRIYNVRGELVRTILENDSQIPGRYGSYASLKEITWDGLTDYGTMARNGRYLIEIMARDPSGKVTEMIPVVLVK